MKYQKLVIEHLKYEIFKKGETIYFKGDKADKFYMIVWGQVVKL